jgi:amino acid adenylation domain-containing protein
MLTHRNGLAFVEWAVDQFGVAPEDRLSSHAPLHFDLSIFDLFAASTAQATLVLVPRTTAMFPVEVVRFMDRHRITVWYSVPSVLSMVTQQATLPPNGLPRLRTVLFAGEVFPTKYLRRLMTMLPHARFCNLYGPTETNVCTWYDVRPLPEAQTAPIPIGRAIADVEAFAVTEDGRRAEPGEVGELYVRGPTVMQGYWGDPERTARTLLSHPFAPELADRVYRTGDIVMEDLEGNFAFLGRRDAQIKSRGYRIELGEIEAALYANPSVVECAVLAIPDELVTNRLAAVVVTQNGIAADELTRDCSQRIPSYMIPETFEFRDALPKTSTGKVDRNRLAKEMTA